MLRNLRVGLVGIVVIASVLVGGVVPSEPAGAAPDGPFRGLGAWVDVYDYAPAFIGNGALPTVTPASVADMAALGVRTLYLQAAQDDTRSKGNVVDRRLLARFLAAGREHDVRIVAWYLPKFDDLDADLRRIRVDRVPDHALRHLE